MSHVCSDLCLSAASLNLGFMTNILNVGNENRLSREVLSKQEKEKGWSREMCQSYFTTWLNPSYFSSSGESLLSCVFTVSTAPVSYRRAEWAAFMVPSGSNHNQGSEHARTAHTFAACIVSIDPVYLLCPCTLRITRENLIDTQGIYCQTYAF